jgi:group I intron endonuclease
MTALYLLTNIVNGKRYVGVSVDPPARWRQHKWAALRAGAKSALYNAIRKYGAESFKLSILEWCDSRERASDLEKRWIRVCDSRVTGGHGYNISEGGDGAPQTPESRARISATKRASGYQHSVETRQRISVAKRGQPLPSRYVPVIQMTRDGVEVARFSGSGEAAKATGLRSAGIRRCAIGERPTYAGFRWVQVKAKC